VSQSRLGHAFSVHGISGNLGWALAPVFLIGISTWTGDWRMAYAASALVGIAVLSLLLIQRDAIDDRQGSWDHPVATGKAAATTVDEHPMAFLKLPSVWLCFSFFFWTTAALSAIQSFASPALGQMYGLPVSATAFVVTGYMLCGAVGMVLGGFLVAKVARRERTIAAAMAVAASLLLLTATGWLPAYLAVGVAAVAGFGTGPAGPSRDMPIQRASPPGAPGPVVGPGDCGPDLEFSLSPPILRAPGGGSGWTWGRSTWGPRRGGGAAMPRPHQP